MQIHQHFIDFFLMFFFVASFIGAILSLIRGEVEFKSRAWLWGNYRVSHLRSKPAYIYAVFTLIGSFILVSNLSFKPIFRIETGSWGLLLWGIGIVFYIIAAAIAQKYQEE
jgi:hypothetical protein